MNGNLRHYANVGLVHHLLYPASMDRPEEHVQTLLNFVQRDDIATFDCCLPYGNEYREKLVPAIRTCGKTGITFATHLFPLRKMGFATPVPSEQAQARIIVDDMIEQAAAIGATGFIFASGQPSPAEATPAHFEAFADFVRWLCARLKPHGITALLEPFDTTIDKRFLYGSTQACVDLIRSLQPEADNLGIELDIAHLPLMNESFESAIRNVAPYLKRVHLGNCVLRDTRHPLYGDKHPPIGYPGGEIDVPEVTEALRALLDVGFLDAEHPGDLLIEMTPWPGRSVEETVQDGFQRLYDAWKGVSA